MESILNIDLLWVGIAVSGAGMLGFSVYFSQPKSATARTFLYFALVSIFWSLSNFASGRFAIPWETLAAIRIVLFFASWHAFTFLLFAIQFPQEKNVIKKRYAIPLLIWTAFISLFVLTPLVYSSVQTTTTGVVTQTAPGIALFGITVLSYILSGIILLVRRYFRSRGTIRRQMELVMTGFLLTFVFLITFDFILPAFFDNSALVPYGGLFLLPFIIGTSYAILHYRLFNIRVAIFGLLTFFLGTATFFDIIFSDTLVLVFYRSVELVLILFSGIWLIKSMVREIELTEQLEVANQQLELANEQQVTLIHFITHQIKGFLTKSRNVFSMALEGDFGAIPDELKPMLQMGLESDTQGVQTVQEILNASNIRSGKVTYNMQPFDFAALVKEIVAGLKPNADKKNLALNLLVTENSYTITGDRMQLENAIKNIVDNAIKYTPSGEVNISLSREGALVKFVEQDTGVGITAEDMAKLFTEGGHGKESIKVNVESTGFGLYIVKNIITAHNGKIWAESEGAGKGSKFIIELPAEQSETPAAH